MNNLDLSKVQPVNQPKRGVPKTKRQEAISRHQKPATSVHAKQTVNLHMGLGTVSAEIIEQQILKGLGKWAVSNTAQTPLEELKTNAEILVKGLGPKPSTPTPLSVLGDQPKTPFTYYSELDGKGDFNSINSVDMNTESVITAFDSEANLPEGEESDFEDVEYKFDHSHPAAAARKRTSISAFAPALVRNVIEKNAFHADRATAYVKYLDWLSEKISDSIKEGATYNQRSNEWQTKKLVSDTATALYRDQLSYENSLTDLQRKTIQQDERIAELEALLAKPKRTRRTKEQMAADKENTNNV